VGTGGSFYFVVWFSTSFSTAVEYYFSSLLKVIFSFFPHMYSFLHLFLIFLLFFLWGSFFFKIF